jgi:glycerophosphoryl diester phosphodiesterase
VTTYGQEHGPLAIAHRGGMALAPENTLAAFERSVALGLRYLETDVVTTRDGELLCFHDTSLKRVTGDPHRVADVDASWVRRLRVGGTEPIPALADALHAFPDACFAIDLKDRPSVDAMAALLRANPGWAGRICVAGAWSRWMEALQAQAPEVSIALGWRSLTTLVSWSHGYVPPPRGLSHDRVRGRFAHVPMRLGGVPVYAERVVAQAHRLGIRVCVWTVNQPGTMHALLDAGVDGVITDRPDVLREVLVGRGQWAPTGARASRRVTQS